MKHILTIDLEEWFHVCGAESALPPASWDRLESRLPDVSGELLDLLDRVGARATFFVVGYVADRYPDLVAEVRERGHRIGSHGYLHKRIYEMTPDEFARDLDRSVKAIEKACGVTPCSYRSPEWSLRPQCDWALRILAQRGFTFDSSAVPFTLMGSRSFPRGTTSISTEHGPITEVPLTTVRCFWERLPYTGGLAFRLHPEWYVHRRLQRETARGHPVMVYLHPFDLVRDLPEASLPFTRRIMQRFARGSAPERVSRLLATYRFAPLEEVCAESAGLWTDDSPSDQVEGLQTLLRRSALGTAALFTTLGVAGGLLGAAVGPVSLLLPPAVVAATYVHHQVHALAWRHKRRSGDAYDPAGGSVPGSALVSDRLRGDSADSTAGP